MKTHTKIMILLIVIWQSIVAAGLLCSTIYNIFSSGFSWFHFKMDFITILDILQGVALFGYIPIAIIGIIGLLQRRNYGRTFSIISMAFLILAVCTNFAQNLFFVYQPSHIFTDGSNIILLAFACINILSIIYLDRLKID
jgi:hypothetical protein